MIRHPPKKNNSEFITLLSEVYQKKPELFQEYLKYSKSVDDQGRYLPFDKFRFRIPKYLDIQLVWMLVKTTRDSQARKLVSLPKVDELQYNLTPTIEKAISFVDRFSTNTALEAMSQKLNEQHHFDFLFNDLVAEEAISSSQLEGAATTTLKAKELLRKKRNPKTLDEKMILGNFKMMQFAWDNRKKHLTLAFIKELHEIGVKGISDKMYSPGMFRDSNNVVVADRDDEVLHYPPNYEELDDRLRSICDWINREHTEQESEYYLHPLIKAITLHFLIGHEHPFFDGNGRVARALFYWYLFKNNYGAFRYIAISTLLKKAPAKYSDSYLYTENDSMDMTYFIEYQCKIMFKALERFRDAYKDALKIEEEFDRLFYSSPDYKKMNQNQKSVFIVAKIGDYSDFTVKDVQNNLEVSNNTASQILKSLVDLGLFTHEKKGRTMVYNIYDRKTLIKKWK